MKILHIISSSGMYGAEAVVLNLAKSLNAEGHDCQLGIFSHTQQAIPALYTAAKARGIGTHLLTCTGQVDFTVPQQIRKIMAHEEIDVLHAHGYKADVYVRISSSKLAAPLISTCHTWHDTTFRDRLYGVLDRFVLREFDAVIAVSSEVERRLLSSGVPIERIHRVRNGIDVSAFTGTVHRERSAKHPLLVGLACRLAHEKGIDIFAHMAAKILKQEPNARFVIAGDGEQKAMLQNLLVELKISQNVILLGRVDGMADFYASLDILISSSRSEGFPMSLLEAMASGVPIIATAVGEVPKIVRSGETGTLVPSGDVDALASATLDLLRNAGQRTRYGQNARNIALREFTASRMAIDNLSIYRQALQQQKRGDTN